MNQKSTRGVQQEEVFAAADALLAELLRPTIGANIRGISTSQ
jgi:hypothetical protein